MPKAVVDANPSNQWLALEPENQPEAAPEETETAAAAAPVAPSPQASKQAWADHAAALGDDPAGLTKTQLVEKYGPEGS